MPFEDMFAFIGLMISCTKVDVSWMGTYIRVVKLGCESKQGH